MPNGDRGLSREQILKQIDASLARLGLEYVDLYQCHRYDDEVALEETLGALTELVRAGKVRFIGVSKLERRSDSPRRGARARAPFREDRLVAAPVLASAPRAGAGRDPRLARERHLADPLVPLAQGVLAGKYRPGESFAAETRAAARGDGFMSQYLGDDVLERAERLRPIADGLGLTMAQLALAWLLHEPNVASPIVGATRPEQVRDNAAASGVELGDDIVRAIEDALTFT